MSYTDVGKGAKRAGLKHPRDLRRTDPVPERPTPKAKPHRKDFKAYGVSYEFKGLSFLPDGKLKSLWEQPRITWYKTAQAREQGLAAMKRHAAEHDFYRNVRAIDR